MAENQIHFVELVEVYKRNTSPVNSVTKYFKVACLQIPAYVHGKKSKFIKIKNIVK
jgi:hypothetical protein